MTTLHSFKDDDRKGRWANIRMDNGDPCWISVAQTGILVKKSKLGFMGAKLYEETNVHEAVKTGMALSEQYPDDLTPDGMTNPVLKAVVNTVLHCSSLAEVTRVLNGTGKLHEAQQPSNKQSKSFKDNLLEISNQLYKSAGFPESHDIEGAATMALTEIVTDIQRKSGLITVEGEISNSEAVVCATFMCFVGSPLILNLEEEDVNLSFNSVLARAGMAVFQFLEHERAMEIVQAGVEQYKAIIKSGNTHENIKTFTENVNKAVWLYIMTKDERMMEALHSLFRGLLDARQD